MKRASLRGQNGQATIEYVLLMFVIMITVVGTLYTFSKSAQTFLMNYWGAYFQCLLETGELPTLGSQTDNNGTCNASFQPFTLANGRPPVDSGEQNKSDQNSADASKSKANSSGAGAAGEDHSDGFADSSSAGSSANKKIALNKKEKAQALQEGSRYNHFAQNGGDEDSSDDKDRLIRTGIYLKGNYDEESKQSIVAKDIKDDEEKLSPKRVPANFNKKEKPKLETDTSLTLPDILRYLLIIGIVLAIVIFFGNQVMQFQKSKE